LRKSLYTLIFISFILFSCEENISYLGKFEQQYSLNCILRSDKDIQFATLKMSYPPGETLPNTDVKGAIIKLILPDTTLFFKDSVLADNTTGIPPVKSFYYLENYRLKKGTTVKIEAILPGGKTLSAETHSPYFNKLYLVEGSSPTIIPTEYGGDTYYYKWEHFGIFGTFIYGPSFYVRYFVSGNEAIIRYKEVSGKKMLTNEYKILTSFVDDAMRDISSGIDDKSKVHIMDACFEVKVFDNALGIYVNSIKTFEDEFSVRISEPNISNINGGLGIFGTYISEQFDIGITSDYIQSFGYTPVN